MITLKKSFELQNYLKQLFDSAITVLTYTDNVTTTKQQHMRKKAYDGAEDEEIVKPKKNDYQFSIMELVDFACDIQKEMEQLTTAINKAKHSADNDFDSLIAINNRKRTLLGRFSIMANIKASENITTGTSTKFNEAGDQVRYNYDIKEVTTIDFDRDAVKAIVSRLRKEVDSTSTEIDLMQLNTMVEFDTVYEIGESLEDAVLKYTQSK